MTEAMFNTREAARLLGVHENTIRNMVEDGRLVPAVFAGKNGHPRFHREALEEQLALMHQTAPDPDEVAGAIKLRADARLRAKAQGQARQELAKRHPVEYAELYQAARKRLENER